ncbi:MAG TPA: PDZ domain-containing protein [Bacilli bacterium]
MDFTLQLWYRFTDALLQLTVQPFYYIGILLVVLQYRRQILLERKLFHTRLHSLLQETWRLLLWGLAGGAVVSLIMAFFGAVFYAEDIILLWMVSLLLLLFRVRFLCFAYSVGILGILHTVVVLFPDLQKVQELSLVVEPLANLHYPSLLALVGVLHLIEALLIRWQGVRAASPAFYEGKRGKIVGGYYLHGFWPIPLFLIVPLHNGDAVSAATLPWVPFLGGDVWSAGWTLLALPVVIGFSEMTVSRLPGQKVRLSSGMLLMYSVIMIVLAVSVEAWPIITMAAALGCILFHEVLIWYSRWEELQRSPLYVHDERGLMILGIVPDSPADAMGIVPGEIIYKANGMKVLSREQLHQGLRINPAFCKLEIINLEGQSKFIKRAIYAGEHHELGIILAPDSNAQYYVGFKHAHVFSYIRLNVSGLFRKKNKEA